MNARILLVEDDAMISDIVRYNLTREGCDVVCAADGPGGLALALEGNFDLLLLDVMLPGLDGFEICRRVREKSDVPVIMLTAREDESDKVYGLDLGADDYVTKPFSMRELLSRVRANLRRRIMDALPASEENRLVFGPLTISQDTYTVTRGGEAVDLTAREFEMLRFLASQPDRVFSREELMQSIWGYDYIGDSLRAVDVAVRRLREKLEDDPAVPRYILTHRGIGYSFCSKQE